MGLKLEIFFTLQQNVNFKGISFSNYLIKVQDIEQSLDYMLSIFDYMYFTPLSSLSLQIGRTNLNLTEG